MKVVSMLHAIPMYAGLFNDRGRLASALSCSSYFSRFHVVTGRLLITFFCKRNLCSFLSGFWNEIRLLVLRTGASSGPKNVKQVYGDYISIKVSAHRNRSASVCRYHREILNKNVPLHFSAFKAAEVSETSCTGAKKFDSRIALIRIKLKSFPPMCS